MLAVLGCLVGELFSPNIVNSAGDIAPLVAAAKLEVATVLLVQDPEVVRLQRLIRELGETHALGVLTHAFEPTFDRVARHHSGHSKMFAYVTQELKAVDRAIKI